MTVAAVALLKIDLPSGPTSPRTARHALTGVLGELVNQDCTDVIELLVSELVTNAVVHAQGAVELKVWADPDLVRVEVTDGSRSSPQIRDYGPEATTGRGVRLLDNLATRWGVELGSAGKTVWFEFATDSELQVVEDPYPFDVVAFEALDAP
jgi:anti-sigma regulatory factor (Ser/Thr protein kinase)